MEIDVIDFKTAYLNALLILDDGEYIYMIPPPRFRKYNAQGVMLYWKLKKSVYGLKQSARMWNRNLHDWLVSDGFTRCESDHAVYVKRTTDGEIMYLLTHVDDTVITSNRTDYVQQFKARVAMTFKITDLGPISSLLGMHITRNRAERSMTIDQTAYIQAVLNKVQLPNLHAVDIPAAVTVQLTAGM